MSIKQSTASADRQLEPAAFIDVAWKDSHNVKPRIQNTTMSRKQAVLPSITLWLATTSTSAAALVLQHRDPYWACSTSLPASSSRRKIRTLAKAARGKRSTSADEAELDLPPEADVNKEKKDITVQMLARWVSTGQRANSTSCTEALCFTQQLQRHTFLQAGCLANQLEL
jgi:hypothetical protein